MNFEALKRRVECSERLVEGRLESTREHRGRLTLEWRQAWTPGRIVVVGLIGGFLIARARPLRFAGAVSATRWMQLATSLSGLFASLQAAHAAQTAESAANEAGSAAETVDAAAGEVAVAQADAGIAPQADLPRPTVSDGRRRADPQWDAAPAPAEAATELSER